MKLQERRDYKRKRIRDLYVYAHKTIRETADILNNDAEFIRICGKTNKDTVMYWKKKIDAELENDISSDAIEKYTAEYIRKMNFMDSEISDISKALDNTSLKDDDKLKLMRFKHQVVMDQLQMLQDHELPLAIKKLKNDRKKSIANLKLIPDPDEKLPEVKFVRLKDSPVSTQEDSS